MPEQKSNKLNKTTRLGAWYGKQGNLVVPAPIQDIWLNLDTEFVHVDALQDRMFETFVLTFGPIARENVKLETSEIGWVLATPFGSLTFVKDQFSSCSLAENDGNLVFTSRSARPRIVQNSVAQSVATSSPIFLDLSKFISNHYKSKNHRKTNARSKSCSAFQSM